MPRERIVIASQSRGGLDDMVSPVFGRCPAFTVVDVEDGKIVNVSVHQNPAMMAPMGAGIQAAQFIGSLGANVVIAGNFGPNAFTALSSLGIKVIAGVMGVSVREAVQRYLRGELSTVTAPTAPMHAGMMMKPGMFWRMQMQMQQPPQPVQQPMQPSMPSLSRDAEIRMLEERRKFLKQQLEWINKRLKELKGEEEEEEY
ncbi:MAG: NifB/NifX family molybdenum-iron cluster-binding protein [Candidatus Baldrarchaeia archaeon]